MKKKFPFLSLFLFLSMSLLAQNNTPITLEDIWQKGTFRPKFVQGFSFLKDGKTYSSTNGKRIDRNDLSTGNSVGSILDLSTAKMPKAFPETFDAYVFSADESKIVLETKTEAIYRRSAKSVNYLFDAVDQTIKVIDTDTNLPQSNMIFDKKGEKLAWTAENNLYYKDLKSQKIKKITTDGKKNSVINGFCDWVYEEEFEFTRAFDWSPDGTKIAFLKFEESQVPEFTMQLYKNEMYPEAQTFKYPKVGEKNSVVTAHIYDLKSGKTVTVQGNSEYIPRMRWTPDNQLCIYRLNRLQNDLTLQLVESKTGKTTDLLTEKNANYVEINDDLTFLEDKKHFVLSSEKSGFMALYLYDMQGKEVAQLSDTKKDMTKFYGIDEKRGIVYYQSVGEMPMQRVVYSADLKGGNRQVLFGSTEKNADVQFSSTYDLVVSTESSINTPTEYHVWETAGKKKIRTIEDNTSLRTIQQQYGTTKTEFFQFATPENTTLNGWMMKPTNFDATKKYPVFMTQYSGPGSQKALNQWIGNDYWWYQMLTQKGYIVVCVDGRGTGGRGEAFKKCTYKQLGNLETQDQISAAKWLGSQSYVDKSRIGIFGWSYGGYMSSLCITKGNDVFKTAIAVAPVTNWKWYDNIYTERYMQTAKENDKGYEENSPVNFANLLKGNYLIVHGLADDNVHFQHSAEMINALVKANKQFESFYYPNRNHGIFGGNTRLHLYGMMTDFLVRKL